MRRGGVEVSLTKPVHANAARVSDETGTEGKQPL
jgi:hypothetical protein